MAHADQHLGRRLARAPAVPQAPAPPASDIRLLACDFRYSTESIADLPASQGQNAGLSPLLQVVEIDHQRDQQAFEDHFPEGIDAEQDGAVAHRGEEHGANDRAKHRASAAEQARAADHRRGDRLQLIGVGHRRRSDAEPGDQEDAGKRG